MYMWISLFLLTELWCLVSWNTQNPRWNSGFWRIIFHPLSRYATQMLRWILVLVLGLGSFCSTCLLQYILHKQMYFFQDFIPKMAKEYDFEYELVQYKWPRWLNQQKEKQRVMWGYVHVKSEKSMFFYRSNCFILMLFIQHRILLELWYFSRWYIRD